MLGRVSQLKIAYSAVKAERMRADAHALWNRGMVKREDHVAVEEALQKLLQEALVASEYAKRGGPKARPA